MTDYIPDVPAMVGQIYEDLEKEKTRGTVFYVQDKSIVIKYYQTTVKAATPLTKVDWLSSWLM